MRPFAYISTTTILFSASIPTVSSFTHPTSVPTTVTTSLQLLPKQGCQLVAASEAIYAKQHQQHQQDKKEHTQDQFHVKNNQDMDQSSSSTSSMCSNNNSMMTPTNAARIFLSRVFSLPSPTVNKSDRPSSKSQATEEVKLADLSSFDSHPAVTTTTTTNTITSHKDNDKNNNEVVYPITGFTFVTTTNPSNPNEMTVHVLPPPNTSRCACNIDSVKQSQSLPLFGWFSPACPLNS